MFDNWRRRRQIHEQWESIALKLTSLPIDATVDKVDINNIIDIIGSSIARYSLGDRLSKKTLRLLGVVKRILADKRQFEVIKSLDYMVACHNISTYKLSKSAKRQIIAYFCGMAVRYLQLTKGGLSANPFHAGQPLRRNNDE